MFKFAACLLLVTGLTGCFSAISVGSWDARNPQGLPFYAKVGRVKQSTVLARTWVQATLSVVYESKSGQKSKPLTARVAVAESDWKAAAILHALAAATVAADSGTPSLEDLPDAVGRGADAFTDPKHGGIAVLDDRTLLAATKPEPLASGSTIVERLLGNDVALVAEADYAHPLCFNVRSPIFGSGSGALEVAPDGTLSKASASADASHFADVVPAKEWAIKQFALAAEGAALLPPEPADHYVVTVEGRLDGCKFTLTRRYDIGPDWTVDQLRKPALGFAEAQGVARVALDAAPTDDSADKVQFSGSVALPKS